MILADTSIWIEHLRSGSSRLAHHLNAGEVLHHPMVVGELAMGNLSGRGSLLAHLEALPAAIVAAHGEVRRFIEDERLYGLGIGFVDAHLLASVRLTPSARLLTHDRRLQAAAVRLGVGA